MSRIYDYDLQKIAKKCAAETGADLKEGTYLQFTGPAYESPQEVAMARTLGADAVGMSTACEGCGGRIIWGCGCGNFLYLESGMRHFATAIVP